MKSITRHAFAVLLLALTLAPPCLAQDLPGTHIRLIAPAHPAMAMPLAPGWFVSVQTGGVKAPVLIAVNITEVRGADFKGELHLAYLDADGNLVKLESGLAGSIDDPNITETHQGNLTRFALNFLPPLTFDVQDEPLRSLLAGPTGSMRPDGFWMQWRPQTKPVNLFEVIGSFGYLVSASPDDYRKTLALFEAMAQARAQAAQPQTASASVVRERFAAYMHDTDKLLASAPHPPDLSGIIAKATALYAQEQQAAGKRTLLAYAAAARAKLLAGQIDVWYWQAHFASAQWHNSGRQWQTEGASVASLMDGSPCSDTGDAAYLARNVAQACAAIPGEYKALEQRMREVRALFDQPTPRQVVLNCLQTAAQHVLNASNQVPGYCTKALQAP